jgi:uncharacterized protein (TIGR00290 family)
MRERVVVSWSGGKDSARALYSVLHGGRYEVTSLVTTCNEEFERISMHGVRLSLAKRQALAIGLPLETIFMSRRSSNDEYRQKMEACLSEHRRRGVTGVVFGDIFLEDLRRWREENLAGIGMHGIFPLWKRDTREVVDEIVKLGFRSVICCVNDAYLTEEVLGVTIDRAFIEALPAYVDPCGENGEFHSFAYAGPIFKEPLRFRVGESVYRPLENAHLRGAHPTPIPMPASGRETKGFWFCDLLDESVP